MKPWRVSMSVTSAHDASADGCAAELVEVVGAVEIGVVVAPASSCGGRNWLGPRALVQLRRFPALVPWP